MPDAPLVGAEPSLKAALLRATADLRRAGVEDAGGDSRRLLAAALGLSAAQVLARPERPMRPDETAILQRYIARRAAREPVSRILGERDFYGRSFAISPATLDPRPDSETLIAATLELVEKEVRPLTILDVGTGSGCLLLTLLTELPSARGVGTDRSLDALHVARRNAWRLGLSDRAQWVAADALTPISGEFDILICNPPYVRSADLAGLDPEVRSHDPPAALDGGEDGLRFFRRLLASCRDVIVNGWIVLEVGFDQGDAVAALIVEYGLSTPGQDIKFYCDVAGRRRCVSARTRN